ncbi:hypothetical protein Tco_0373480 [Tanacetum coccineum]
MSILAEFMIVAGADNRPPMLDKPQYESWKIQMELYIQEDGTVRLKTYEELSDKEKLKADCDLKAFNIVLQGLPPDVYAFFNHHKIAKYVWDRVKLLMQGTSLSRKERKCNMYDEIDKFSHVKGLVVSTFLPSDDPIVCMNKAMAFLSVVFTPRYPSPTINSDIFPIRGIKPLFKMIESPFSKFKEDKAEGKELDEEQLRFLADPEVADGQVAQTITHNAAF